MCKALKSPDIYSSNDEKLLEYDSTFYDHNSHSGAQYGAVLLKIMGCRAFWQISGVFLDGKFVPGQIPMCKATHSHLRPSCRDISSASIANDQVGTSSVSLTEVWIQIPSFLIRILPCSFRSLGSSADPFLLTLILLSHPDPSFLTPILPFHSESFLACFGSFLSRPDPSFLTQIPPFLVQILLCSLRSFLSHRDPSLPTQVLRFAATSFGSVDLCHQDGFLIDKGFPPINFQAIARFIPACVFSRHDS